MTAWARLVMACRSAGIQRTVKLTDALIAATAIDLELPVVGPITGRRRRRRRGRYVYDFGDHCKHKLVVRKIMPPVSDATHPDCVSGRRPCAPEDFGGICGYTEFLAAIGDPGHPEHDSMLDWVGGAFDPDEFDAGDFAHRLQLGRLVP